MEENAFSFACCPLEDDARLVRASDKRGPISSSSGGFHQKSIAGFAPPGARLTQRLPIADPQNRDQSMPDPSQPELP